MKKILSVLAIGLIFLVACTGVKTISTGLENEAFLEFVGNPGNYDGGVNVNIDDKNTFVAEVKKDHSKRPKGVVYAITTGTHTISVTYKEEVIFKKQIFVSAQETKIIQLP
ncbi:MAG: hypothetical protein JEZ03_07950 [Bacteroidales bacterium]|nr:hypothetical protein [Bacteroidales bacterium]